MSNGWVVLHSPKGPIIFLHSAALMLFRDEDGQWLLGDEAWRSAEVHSSHLRICTNQQLLTRYLAEAADCLSDHQESPSSNFRM